MRTAILPRVLLPVLAAVALLGCSQRGAPSAVGGATAGAAPQRTAARDADPCTLLEPGEVEAVAGPLAGKPYRTNYSMAVIEPVADGDTCVYETPDFRAILLTVAWQDGAMEFNALNLPGRLAGGMQASESTAKAAKSLLPGGVEIAGEWDEATSTGCCEIYAMRADQLITFDYRAWRADTGRAVILLNKALLRLEHPLSIDGNAGNAAATQRAQLRPKPQSVCGLLSRAEVEAVLGPLAADPKSTDQDPTHGCTYRFTQAAAKGSPLSEAPGQFTSLISAVTGGRTGLVAGEVDTAVEIRWRTGFRALRDSELVGGAVTTNVGGDQAGLPKRTLGQVPPGPWDEATQTGLNFVAVKKDVAVIVDTEPMLSAEQVELRRRLAAKVVERLPIKD